MMKMENEGENKAIHSEIAWAEQRGGMEWVHNPQTLLLMMQMANEAFKGLFCEQRENQYDELNGMMKNQYNKL